MVITAVVITAGFVIWGGFFLLVPVLLLYFGEKLALDHRGAVTQQVEHDMSPTEGEPPWVQPHEES